MRLDIRTTLIVLLAIALVLLSTCKSWEVKKLEKKIADLENNCEKNPSVIVRIDSIPYKDTIPFYKPIVTSVSIPYSFGDYANEPDTTGWFSPVVLHDTFFHKVDTAAILNDFFTTRFYSDPISSDFGTVTVQDSVSQNRITARRAIWNLNIPRETRTETIIRHKGNLYVGIDAYGNSGGINGAGINLMYSSPRSLNYELGAVLSEGNAINYKAGIKIPLFKK